MPQVTTISSRVRDFTGGIDAFEVRALTIRGLIRELDQRFPGLGAHVEESMAIAIDGEIYQDALGASLAAGSEVVLIPKISGG
ncbi:MAG TPA: MoaD/ThiS family protein [Hyphomonadaceae bacterium]|nr:MoaD/ThiS family protein [Hyphomonadaceae bacterium]